jgi:hypothetical protein
MAAITVKNPIPAEVVALSQETIESRDRLIDAAIEFLRAPITAETHVAASSVYTSCGKLKIAVEKERKRLKAPVLDLGRALDAAAEEATGPLADIESKLSKHIREYERVRDEAIAAEQRRRAEEARRLQAEADARAEQERKRAQEEAEANALPDEPVPEIPVTAHLPVRVEPAPMPDAPKSAVAARLKPHLVIDDISKVPFTQGGVRLWAELDEKACLVLIQAGVVIPGMHVEMREELRRNGGRA